MLPSRKLITTLKWKSYFIFSILYFSNKGCNRRAIWNILVWLPSKSTFGYKCVITGNIWKVLNISYQILLRRNLVPLEFRKRLGWISVMLQGLLVIFNLKQLSWFHYHRAHCFSIYSLKGRDRRQNMLVGLGNIWSIMWFLSVSFFFYILYLSVHISGWKDRQCFYFEPPKQGLSKPSGKVMSAEGKGGCWLRVVIYPFPPTHTPASANPVSWCLSCCLVGWTHSLQLIFN